MKKLIVIISLIVLWYLAYYGIQQRKNKLQNTPECEFYIRQHIGEISSIPAVLWGKRYVTNITNSRAYIQVEYEDGHIANTILVNCKKQSWSININVIK